MSNGYRPITDTWLLGRGKVGYYGSYPCGFLLRARDLLGVHPLEPVLHVCAGRVKAYSDPEHGVRKGVSVRGFGPNDRTLDIDPATEPDFCQDAREPLPGFHRLPDGPGCTGVALGCVADFLREGPCRCPWPAILIDPPYTPEDAAHYACGAAVFPEVGLLLRNALAAVRPGGRVAVLHYIWPRPPEGVRCIAKVSVNVGYANRDRCYSVFERPLAGTQEPQEGAAGAGAGARGGP